MIIDFMLNFWGFLILNFLIALNAGIYALLNSNFKIKNWSKLTLTFFVFFITQIFVSQITLGIIDLLNYQNLWILNSLILITTIGYLYFTKKITKVTKCQFPPTPIINWFAFLSLLSPLIILFLVQHFFALYQVPIEYDSVAYHLPFVVEWYQSGNLTQLYYNAFAGPIAYYPSNFELIELWTFWPFGNDLFINFINFLLFPILVISFYSVLKNFKVQENIIWGGVLFLLSMPIFSHFLGLSHVDLFFVTNFIIAIYFLQEFQQTKNFNDLNVAGLSIGLFIGTKYLGIPYSAPLFIAALILFVLNTHHTQVKTINKNIFQFIFFVMLGGSFWYIRNWINAGNPVFPTDVIIGEQTIFQGYGTLTERIFNDTLQNNVINIFEIDQFLDNFIVKGGVQTYIFPLIFILCIGYLSFTLFQYFFHRNDKKRTQETAKNLIIITSLLSISCFFAYLYWNAPYSYSNLIANIRYALPFFAITTILITLLTQKIKPIQPIFLFILPTLSIYNIFFFNITSENHHEIVLNSDKVNLDIFFISENIYQFFQFLLFNSSFCFSVYLLIITLNSHKNHKYHCSLILGISILTTINLMIQVFQYSQQSREANKDHLFKEHYIISDARNHAIIMANNWLDTNANTAKIAYTGFNFHYHLFGRNLQREVDYVNINDCQNCRYVDFKDSPQSIRRDPDFKHWLANLKHQNKTHVIIGPTITPHVKNYEFIWTQENPKIFKEVHNEDEVHIYEIKYPSKKI